MVSSKKRYGESQCVVLRYLNRQSVAYICLGYVAVYMQVYNCFKKVAVVSFIIKRGRSKVLLYFIVILDISVVL